MLDVRAKMNEMQNTVLQYYLLFGLNAVTILNTCLVSNKIHL